MLIGIGGSVRFTPFRPFAATAPVLKPLSIATCILSGYTLGHFLAIGINLRISDEQSHADDLAFRQSQMVEHGLGILRNEERVLLERLHHVDREAWLRFIDERQIGKSESE